MVRVSRTPIVTRWVIFCGIRVVEVMLLMAMQGMMLLMYVCVGAMGGMRMKTTARIFNCSFIVLNPTSGHAIGPATRLMDNMRVIQLRSDSPSVGVWCPGGPSCRACRVYLIVGSVRTIILRTWVHRHALCLLLLILHFLVYAMIHERVIRVMAQAPAALSSAKPLLLSAHSVLRWPPIIHLLVFLEKLLIGVFYVRWSASHLHD